ncbi:MAG: LacI family DNA-binding transcriptional regulator [Bacteroidia bacterium]|nr:LacI family DNA-binding transcriptional regulator [Bacteroidia bacterium]
MKRTSLADIANALGVSPTLVSMVLNHRGDKNGISPETQKKVREKAKELNYQPNRMARGLRLGRSNTIGLIVADISNSFYAQIARSIEDEAAKQGYHLLVSSSDEKENHEKELIERFLERQVDGLIISTTLTSSDTLAELWKRQMPFVLIDRYFPSFQTNFVIVDNAAASEKMVSHLIQNGYTRIGLLTITPGHISSICDRVEGYKTALRSHNIEFDPRLVKEISFDHPTQSVNTAIEELLYLPDKVEAIFALNNRLAVTCLECLSERQISIPEEMALVSFDDENLFRFCHPPITAIAQPVKDIGKEAFRVLKQEMDTDKPPENIHNIVLSATLEVRKSAVNRSVLEW